MHRSFHPLTPTSVCCPPCCVHWRSEPSVQCDLSRCPAVSTVESHSVAPPSVSGDRVIDAHRAFWIARESGRDTHHTRVRSDRATRCTSGSRAHRTPHRACSLTESVYRLPTTDRTSPPRRPSASLAPPRRPRLARPARRSPAHPCTSDLARAPATSLSHLAREGCGLPTPKCGRRHL